MNDIVTRLRRAEYVMFSDGWQSSTLPGAAADEIERLQTELEHFYALAVDDPGKNPPTFWKDRVAALAKALEVTPEMINRALAATDFSVGPVSRRWMRSALRAALDAVKDR